MQWRWSLRRGIQNLEQGKSCTPRRDTVDLLAEALGLSAQDHAELVTAAGRQPLAPASPSRLDRSPLPSARTLSPLVGREPQLALLEQFLTGDADPVGQVPLLLLAGEPGIGKTRLLEAAAQQGITQGWCVLTGGCQRHGGQEPYAPLLDALAQHLQRQTPAGQVRELEGCAWLVRLLPELAEILEPVPAAQLPPEQERRLLFTAVSRFLANVAGPAGTLLLLLDDLQWAGSDALDLLTTLVHSAASGRADGGQLRVIGAYRDTEVGPTHPLALVRADLAPAGLVWHHSVGPLEAGEATTLLAHLLVGLAQDDPAVTRRVLQRAGGTPFFLISYAQALKLGNTDEVPWDLGQGVRQRLTLAPAARDVLGAAAIIGRRVPRALLGAVTDQPDEMLLAGLEAACGARLLLEQGEDAYVFAHDVIREVVEADLGAARRAMLHRRVAEALLSIPTAPPEQVAYHYARAGVQDRAAAYLEQAGDRAWRELAGGAAETQYREALQLLEASGQANEVARLREKLADVLRQTGRYNAALLLLEQAADALADIGDWSGLGRVTAQLGWAHYMQGTPEAGIARVTAVLDQLAHGGIAPSARLQAVLAALLFRSNQYHACLDVGTCAAELARATGDTYARVLADGQRVNILQMLGRLTEALQISEEVLPLVEAEGDLEAICLAHADRAYIQALRGDLRASRSSCGRALAAAEQTASLAHLSNDLALRGWIALLTGDLRSARADLDRAVDLRQQAPPQRANIPLTIAARLALVAGDWASAAATGQEAFTLAQKSDNLQILRWAAGVLAELDIQEGHPAAASARLEPLLDREGLEECDVTVLLPLLAWAHLDQGQVDQATDEVTQALARARREEMRLVLVEALRIQALIALRRGAWSETVTSLDEGLSLARAMPHPYAEARLLSVDAQVFAAQAKQDPARERLEAALAIFHGLGALKDIEQTEQALARLRVFPSLHALRR